MEHSSKTRRFQGIAAAGSAMAAGLMLIVMPQAANVAENLNVATTAAGSATAAAYNCPWGRACLYEGWGGAGWRWVVPSCGGHSIPLKNIVSSVKTHGNGLLLVDDDANGEIVGFVGPWTETNLAGWENDRADSVFVYCS